MHQCVHCGKIYESVSREILEGCSCGSKFFFFIKKGQLDKAIEQNVDLPEEDKLQIERDVREIIGDVDEEMPVILDLESVRVVSPGKFELDLVNLFNKKRPLVYKLEEGKYIIDLASTLRASMEEKDKKN